MPSGRASVRLFVLHPPDAQNCHGGLGAGTSPPAAGLGRLRFRAAFGRTRYTKGMSADLFDEVSVHVWENVPL